MKKDIFNVTTQDHYSVMFIEMLNMQANIHGGEMPSREDLLESLYDWEMRLRCMEKGDK